MNAQPTKTPRQRFWRLMQIMLAITTIGVVAVYAVLIRIGTPFHLHFFIAIGLGVFFSLMLAGVLMGLVFLSNRSGHDAEVADEIDRRRDRDDDPDWRDEP